MNYENTILNFIGNNKSILDNSKWIDTTVSVNSTTKLLTSIHPVVKKLENIVETNTDQTKTINSGDDNSVLIPLNIYFKMNSLDNNQPGLNYQYIDLNRTRNTVKHVKKVKFLLENESDNKDFTFIIKFNINRSKVINYSQNLTIAPYIQRGVNTDIDFNLRF